MAAIQAISSHAERSKLARKLSEVTDSEDFKKIFSAVADSEEAADAVEKLTDRLKTIEDAPEKITHRKFMPDGSIMITETEDGEVVNRYLKKPHMIPMPDPSGALNADGSVKMKLVPHLDILDMLMM